jgi:ABC-type glycerol-3-phosphate transport system substrate-binding protein
MRRSLALMTLLTAVLVSAAAGSAATGRAGDTTLSVVAYSIPTAVIPKLDTAYQATPAGAGVKFTTSFAASEV